MLKFILLVCFSIVGSSISSQIIYERTFTDAFPSIQYPIEFHDSSTFSMDEDDTFCNRVQVRFIDANGYEIENNFGFEAFYYGYAWLGHDSILVWSERGAWDVGPDSFKVTIWTPTSVIDIHKQKVRWDLFGSKYGAFLLQNDHIVLQINDTLYLKNIISNEIEVVEFIPDIEKIVELKDGILVVGENGTGLLYHSTLNLVHSIDINSVYPNAGFKTVVIDSFLVNTNPESFTTIDYFNAFTKTSYPVDLSGVVDSILQLQANKGFLFVHGVKEMMHFVIQLNEKHEIVAIHALDIPNIKANMQLQFFPTRVYAWAIDGLGAYKADYRICYRYLNPTGIKFNDIALDSIWIQKVTDYMVYQIVQIACHISNFSDDTIQNVTLHYDTNDPTSTCFSGTKASHFQNLNIAPGGTYLLSFESISAALTYSNSLIRGYYLEHGNHHLDPDTTNNFKLLEYILSDIEDEHLFPLPIIYPNPFTNTITVSYPAGNIEIILYDNIGKVVASANNRLNDLDHLLPGIYTAVLMTNERWSSQRVIKVE